MCVSRVISKLGKGKKEIPLSQGKVALVSERDFAFLNSFKWYAKKSDPCWYAVRREKINRRAFRGLRKSARVKKDRRRTIRMHNAIMNPTGDEVVHHKNRGNDMVLDNTRENLECCSVYQNVIYAQQKQQENEEDNIPI